MVASSLRHPITLGDKTYQVSPLDDDSLIALDEYVRAKFVARTAPLIEALKSEKDKQLAFAVAFRQSFALTWLSGEGAKTIGTVDGMAHLLYEGVRKNHPEVTVEELRRALFDPVNVRKANAVFTELNTDRPAAEQPGASNDPKAHA